MNAATQKLLIAGPNGPIEVSIDQPASLSAQPPQPARGIALVAHPHPLFGGTMDNKVAQTLARAMVQLGYIAVRPNFRGVGQSAGVHDDGRGETDDLEWLAGHIRTRFAAQVASHELILAGFSFGSFVQTHVAQRLAEAGIPAHRLVLVGTAASRWAVANVPEDTLVIHGELDETVPLTAVLDWARPQNLPVVVIPGADHFFHRRLNIIKRLILNAWLGDSSGLGAVDDAAA